MDKIARPVDPSDLLLVEFEDRSGNPRIVRCKHGSKHMSFNSGEYAAREVIERSDGVAYDRRTATFYQSKSFSK